MAFIHYIIFAISFGLCNGIKCVDEGQVQLSSSELTSTNIRKTLNELKYSSRMKCQMYMEFDYMDQKLTIQFGQSVELPRLRSVENVYVHIVTSIVLVNPEKKMNATSIKTKVHLLCYNGDKCDRQFVLEYFDWLMKTDYRNLESIIRPLILVQGNKKDECTVGYVDDVKPCYNTACSWYYSMDTNKGYGKCENIDPSMLSSLNLITKITMFVKYQKPGEEESKPSRAIFKHSSSIQFSCELNNCNNQLVGNSIKEAVHKYYDFGMMHKIGTTNRM